MYNFQQEFIWVFNKKEHFMRTVDRIQDILNEKGISAAK